MAFKLDLIIEQGATFKQGFEYVNAAGFPISIVGWDARMQIRQTKQDPLFILELTVSNGRISLGGLAGTIDLTIPSSVTAALNFTQAVYDLELIDPIGDVIRLIEGKVILSYEVTK